MEKRAGQISASMMCADVFQLKEIVELFERHHIDYLHIDIMDGLFVPNFGLGTDYIQELRKYTDIPLDLHLMVRRPEEKLDWLNIQPSDAVSLHLESTVHIQRVLEQIRNFGCKTFLAINPSTPIMLLEESLEYIDGVNVLMVNPGFAGQKIVHSCIKKVEKLKQRFADLGLSDMLIEVDGNISFQNAELLRHLGADIFVAGSSSLFSPEGDMEKNIVKMQSIIL